MTDTRDNSPYKQTNTLYRMVEYFTLPVIGSGGGLTVASVLEGDQSMLAVGLGLTFGGALVYTIAEIVGTGAHRHERTHTYDRTHEATHFSRTQAEEHLCHLRTRIKRLEAYSAILGYRIRAYQTLLGRIQSLENETPQSED